MTATELLNQRLAGRYTIERELGRGGMATVYLARDIKHDRHVALKVLDPELGAVIGGERFLSEIRVTAHLQHPNLLPLFDSGDADGLLFYVMPFVEGESLGARLEREHQLPVDEAVRIAVAIASAVDYAHRHGVIHRDLKPANILLHDGQPLIADFGIALAVTKAGGERITQTGLSLGTPQYMSPEQATGDRAVDGRTDIYSLGAVTYEMLAGEPPHGGKTAQAIIAKLMTEEPRPVTMLRRTVPAHVESAVHRALQKLPADRYASAREFGEALQLRGEAAQSSPLRSVDREPARNWRTLAVATSTIALVAAATAIWAWRRPPPSVATLAVRFELAAPDSIAVNTGTSQRSLALSPDGTQIAYTAGPASHVFIRRLNELVPHVLVSQTVSQPSFSPDGKYVAFLDELALKRIPVGGGSAVQIAEGVGPFAWGSGGTIVFARGGTPGPALYKVSAEGGTVEQLTPPPLAEEAVYGAPTFLPDGDAVLFPITSNGMIGPNEIAAIRLSDRKVIRLGISGANPVYLSTGHILSIGPDGSGAVTPFDARRLQVTGKPVSVLQDVLTKSVSLAEISVSSNGVLMYAPGQGGQQLVELDRSGTSRLIAPMTRRFRYPRYSPDGRRIVVAIGQMPASDIWVLDIGSSTLSRVTNDGYSVTPEWSSDGRRIAWTRPPSHATPGTWWRPSDLSGPAEVLVADSRGAAMSPTGGFMITHIGTPTVVTMVQLDSTRRRTPLIESIATTARVSPDGKWIAYSTAETGQREVYVRALSGPGGVYQISNGGGFEPMWNPRGGELFYRAAGRLFSAALEMVPAPRVTRRDTLFAMNIPFGLVEAQYDVSADGQRFLMPKPIVGGAPPVIVVGWLDEVRERLAAAAKK